jgi:hypothetical protein
LLVLTTRRKTSSMCCSGSRRTAYAGSTRHGNYLQCVGHLRN